MSVSRWLSWLPPRLFGPRLSAERTTPQARRSVRPSLEALEDRIAQATIAPPFAAAPTQSQALISLFLDGATIEATNLTFDSIDNIDSFFGTPSQVAAAESKAATMGVNFDAAMSLVQLLDTAVGRSVNMVRTDIAFYVPYVGPFAELAVLAGGQAALQFAQLPPSSS